MTASQGTINEQRSSEGISANAVLGPAIHTKTTYHPADTATFAFARFLTHAENLGDKTRAPKCSHSHGYAFNHLDEHLQDLALGHSDALLEEGAWSAWAPTQYSYALAEGVCPPGYENEVSVYRAQINAEAMEEAICIFRMLIQEPHHDSLSHTPTERAESTWNLRLRARMVAAVRDEIKILLDERDRTLAR